MKLEMEALKLKEEDRKSKEIEAAKLEQMLLAQYGGNESEDDDKSSVHSEQSS